jgi:ectoine hydroxylase-related dioxygenase (phytanoyl-CoA dioxygenase family)
MQELVTDGVAVIPCAISPAHCDDLRHRFRLFEAANVGIFGRYKDTDGHYPRIVNLHVVFPDLFELFARNTKTLALLDAMFDSETCVYTSLYFERGSAQDIHRDSPYFVTKPEYSYFGVWVALEDTDESNGALQVVRGGHLQEELDLERIALRFFPDLDNIKSHSAELWDAYQKELQQQCAERGLFVGQVTVKKGDTIIWHPQLPHGGSPIRDIKRTRHSFVMHVTPIGVPVYQQDVFFNRKKVVASDAPWNYVERMGRRYAHFPAMSFAHQVDYKPTDFAQPARCKESDGFSQSPSPSPGGARQ